MTGTVMLRVGDLVGVGGERRRVEQIIDGAVILRDAGGRYWRRAISDVLSGDVTVAGRDEGAAHGDSLWGDVPEAERARANGRAEHVREVLTGFRSGSERVALPGEPRPEFNPTVQLTKRVRAKAAELSVGMRTVERWIARYREHGEWGLVNKSSLTSAAGVRGLDRRWVDVVRQILDEQVTEPKVTTGTLIARAQARVERLHGVGVVRIPSQSSAYPAFKELDRGRGTLKGPTARKRSIAGRPDTTLPARPATRPGELVLMDTTYLDVFALNPINGEWVCVDMTFALDQYSRCMLGLRLTPVSTKSVDVAAVLIEAMLPLDAAVLSGVGARWPYHGVPDTVIIHPERIRTRRFTPSAMIPDSITTDHGRPFISEHVTSACARIGISVQPARVHTPTDKAPVERYFRTLNTFLQELPGYKGPDTPSRGVNPEQEAVYTIPQLEQIIREWMATVYHLRPHPALVEPGLPGVSMSPAERFEQGIAIAGVLRMPADRDIVFTMLPVVHRKFHHYGVDVNGMRYNGEIVLKYRNRSRSLYEKSQTWPFSIDPTDIRRIYFHDPDDHTWHVLDWDLQRRVDVPFSRDALEYAKRLAVNPRSRADVVRATAQILDAWGAGRHLSPQERRLSARAAAQIDAPRDTSLRAMQHRLDRFTTQDHPALPEPPTSETLLWAEDTDSQPEVIDLVQPDEDSVQRDEDDGGDWVDDLMEWM